MDTIQSSYWFLTNEHPSWVLPLEQNIPSQTLFPHVKSCTRRCRQKGIFPVSSYLNGVKTFKKSQGSTSAKAVSPIMCYVNMLWHMCKYEGSRGLNQRPLYRHTPCTLRSTILPLGRLPCQGLLVKTQTTNSSHGKQSMQLSFRARCATSLHKRSFKPALWVEL